MVTVTVPTEMVIRFPKTDTVAPPETLTLPTADAILLPVTETLALPDTVTLPTEIASALPVTLTVTSVDEVLDTPLNGTGTENLTGDSSALPVGDMGNGLGI